MIPRLCIEFAKHSEACHERSQWLREEWQRIVDHARLPVLRDRRGRFRLTLEDGLPPRWASARERLWLELRQPYPSACAGQRLQAVSSAGIEVLCCFPWHGAPVHHRRRCFRVTGLEADGLLRQQPQLRDGWVPSHRPESRMHLLRHGEWGIDFLLDGGGRGLPSFQQLLEVLHDGPLPEDVAIRRLEWRAS